MPSREVTPAWIDNLFAADSAQNGGVVRRDVEFVKSQSGGLQRLIQEAQKKNFHVIETGEQIVVLCHDGSMQVYC